MGGLLLTFIATLAQTCHSGTKEATILIYGYGLKGVLPLTYLSVWCMLPQLVPNTRVNLCSKTWQQILLKFKLWGALYYWEGISMCVLQRYHIPLTLATFVNCYRRLSSLRLNNQVLWLRDRTMTLVLAARAASIRAGPMLWRWVAHLQWPETWWRIKGVHLLGKWGVQHYWLYCWLTFNLVSCYTPCSDNRWHSLLCDVGRLWSQAVAPTINHQL